jgi:hypothetical protein
LTPLPTLEAMKLLRVAGALLAVGLAVAGCGDKATSTPAPAGTPASTPGGAPTASPTATPISPQAVRVGSDGLTVRYTGEDGSTKTLRVEDFPR